MKTFCCYSYGVSASSGHGFPFLGFAITLKYTTLSRTHLNERSARRSDIYLTKHNTYKRQTSKSPVGFEPTISASKRQQSHALDCAATGIGMKIYRVVELKLHLFLHSKPEVRDSLHIPNFSTHRDKVLSGNHLI
jgi:hypothetical protein